MNNLNDKKTFIKNKPLYSEKFQNEGFAIDIKDYIAAGCLKG